MFCVTFTSERRARCESVLRSAIAKSSGSLKAAAIEAEISSPQLTRQLAAEEGTLKRLYMLPDDFWQWLAVVAAQEFGLPPEMRVAQALAAFPEEKREASCSQ